MACTGLCLSYFTSSFYMILVFYGLLAGTNTCIHTFSCLGIVKPECVKRPKMVFKTDNRLMPVTSIAECSKGNILQYFRPSFSYQLSLRSLFCLFLKGRFRQDLL